MKKLRVRTWIAIFLMIAMLLITVVPMITNPMRRSSRMVRNHILRHTPLGTSIEDAVEIIENMDNWGQPRVNLNRGFLPRWHLPEWPACPYTGSRVIGEKSIFVRMDDYRAWYRLFFIAPTRVMIYWGFDGDGNLIEVWVWKDWAP